MLHAEEMLPVKVALVESIGKRVKRFTFVSDNKQELPSFTAGSHILVHMQKGDQRISRAYSLTNSPSERDCYQIVVQLEELSKGGSSFMHSHVSVGTSLTISAPKNLFALAPEASHHILIAGGIGITPFLSQVEKLNSENSSFTLHFAMRDKTEHALLCSELSCSSFAQNCRFYPADQGTYLNLSHILESAPAEAHFYVCGPQGLIKSVQDAAMTLGVPNKNIHWEKFTQDQNDSTAFTLVLNRSGHELQIPEGVSILDAIEKANLAKVDCMCREGVCGTCETLIIEGEADHRDQFLTTEEKNEQKSMLICVSRSRGKKLVLDL
ncbi:PDR/VanB family oxidoreductase [Pseudomonas nitroreducens]|uniref:PDR/VanB family oxidoreductase n=1 Tax=Pseudomonas nitroreducens TaxID=46680 RepID=UPI0028A600D7|nr:PDR/VanB family oxidoreductase [Pseudomonas nitroreducens]